MTRVAAIQMTSSVDVGGNLAVAAELLRESRARGASVAALPENFAFMGLAETDKLAIAEDEGDGPIQATMASLAAVLTGAATANGRLPVATSLHDGRPLPRGSGLTDVPSC